MRQLFRRKTFKVTLNKDFLAVIQHCSLINRRGQGGSWITEDFVTAYYNLHLNGWAHSVEVWQDDKLVGGLYGVAIGSIFSGESMFSNVSNASKFGFITFAQWLASRNFALIDCQSETEHLGSLGAYNIPRTQFMEYIIANDTSIPLFSSGEAEEITILP